MPIDTTQHASPNWDERNVPVDILLLHYTGMRTGPGALRKLSDPAPVWSAYADDIHPRHFEGGLSGTPAPVSAHYLVEEDGRVFALVAEEKRAWHAMTASWKGESNVADRAIGIEIVNGGHDWGLPEFPEPQIKAVIALCRDILGRWPIAPTRVLGHSDVTPDFKIDPGERFPWARLAAAGVGLWPGLGSGDRARIAAAGEAGPRVERAQGGLIDIGYGLEASGVMDARNVAVVTAFQRRYRPGHVDGVLDAETAALIDAVAAISTEATLHGELRAD